MNKKLLIIVALLVFSIGLALPRPTKYTGKAFETSQSLQPMQLTGVVIGEGQIFEKTIQRSSSSFNLTNNCNSQTEYEKGSCKYVYSGYVIVPYGTLPDRLVSQAVMKEIKEVVPGSPIPSHTIVFNPRKGYKYSLISFIYYEQNTWNKDKGEWEISSNLPSESIQVEAIIAICPEGQMLKDNYCFDARPFCINQKGANVCTNDYQLFCLAFRFENPQTKEGPIYECESHPEYLCVDGQSGKEDGICDTVVSATCSDIYPDVCPEGLSCSGTPLNGFCDTGEVCGNGVCDNTDVLIKQALCWDENMNGICDNVEGEGTYCPTYYEPVCVSSTTYPNSCFAEASGKYTYTSGECVPIVIERQCSDNSDCPIPPGCNLGEAPLCINYECVYTSKCSLKQCDDSSDCQVFCKGVTTNCSLENRCVYNGTCITRPVKELDIWGRIQQWLNDLYTFILSKLSLG